MLPPIVTTIVNELSTRSPDTLEPEPELPSSMAFPEPETTSRTEATVDTIMATVADTILATVAETVVMDNVMVTAQAAMVAMMVTGTTISVVTTKATVDRYVHTVTELALMIILLSEVYCLLSEIDNI